MKSDTEAAMTRAQWQSITDLKIAEDAMAVLRQSIVDLKIALGDMDKCVGIAAESINRINLKLDKNKGEDI